ncbi:Trans-Golgi network integral membrane protein 2 [Papilio machaon]|uniref:Trans-Golgi network integral membrane protein 2 n=1 Tax=Papilio machaon TaxID=76193 RepID=A0A194RTK1_PAPMA|nr:Trans-Golgi network integral membrane protein 2 [Papilio machaon]
MKAASNVIAPAVPVVTSTDTKVIEPVIANTTVISTTKNNIPSSNDETKVANAARPETTGTNIVQPEIKEPNPNFVDQKTNSELNAIKVNEGVKKTSEPGKPKVDEEVNNSEKSVVAQKDKVTVELDDEKTILEEEQPPKKVDIEKEDQLLNNQMKDKEFNVDDVEDDMDSEEDEKPDLQDNSEISIGQGDKQNVEEKPKDNSKSIAPIITSFADKSSGEFISKMPQDEFEEDDDHFFSFFLTAVIIVVLLYILYHNKSKFTKVILGLIVEGRQTGRRRNSRGHAYRRLDTLEQAMSTNSPAPPSKIIY